MKIRLMIAVIALSCSLGLSAMESDPNDSSDPMEDLGTQLVKAAEKGNEQKVIALLARGVDINSVAKGKEKCSVTGQTALHAAIVEGHDKMVNLLLEMGADVNVMDTRGSTPIGCLVSRGEVERVKQFIDKGAHFTNKTASCPTLLFQCGGKNGAAIVPFLVNAGVEVDIKDSQGRTCLMEALHQKDVAMENALIQAGADEKMAREAIANKDSW